MSGHKMALTDGEIAEALQMHQEGTAISAIAERFGVSYQTVWRLIRGDTPHNENARKNRRTARVGKIEVMPTKPIDGLQIPVKTLVSIATFFNQGISAPAIAEKTGINEKRVYRAIRGMRGGKAIIRVREYARSETADAYTERYLDKPTTLTGRVFGDPAPGRSALDQRGGRL